MKTFSYTCRNKTGALVNGSLQALDRSTALQKIKAIGCIPISVKEEKNVVSTATVRVFSRNKILGISTLSILVLGVFTLYLTLKRNLVVKKLPSTASAFVETAPQLNPLVTQPSITCTQKVVASFSPLITNPVTIVQQTPKEITPIQERIITTTPKNIPNEPENRLPKHPNPYKTATEQLLAIAMSVPAGKPVPPLPISSNLNADFEQSLSNKIVVYDDDDEQTLAIKENVAAAKIQLLELVNEGKSVSKALQEYQDQTNQRYFLRIQAQNELSKLYKSGKKSDARRYMEEVNKVFTDSGIEPITLPYSP